MTINIADILKVGLSGLGFLLAFLGYRLLQQTTALPKVPTATVKLVRVYLYGVFSLAVVVGVFGVIDAVVGKGAAVVDSDLQACRDSLSRLDTQTKLVDVTAADLKNGITGHVSRCQALLEKSDAR